MMNTINGYTYGTTAVAPSPVTLAEFEKLKATVLFTDEDVEKMHQAWFKAVTLSVILWCQPYIKDGDF
jgi:hypothetical protein